MPSTKRFIKWEKWIDPFLGKPDDEIEVGNIDDEEYWQDSYQKLEERQSRPLGPKNQTGPVLAGPMGFIPLNEHNLPSKIYNFWMGHANFDITGKVQKIISKVPGVETLDVFTRYRFRVGVGKAFYNTEDEKETDFGRSVLNSITEALCNDKVIKPSSQNKSIDLLVKQLNKKHPFWVVYRTKDGLLKSIGSQNKQEIIDVVAKLKESVIANNLEAV
jgi:hypothetical protein